jgi:primosomal protein N'
MFVNVTRNLIRPATPDGISNCESIVTDVSAIARAGAVGHYCRFHIHLRSEFGERLREMVRSVAAALKTPPEFQWIVDVDPVDML